MVMLLTTGVAVRVCRLKVFPNRVGSLGPTELANMVMLLTIGVAEVLDLVLGLVAVVEGRAPEIVVPV